MATPQDKPHGQSPKTPSARKEFDPDNYRMTIGEHLEELRTRLVLSLIGFAVALIGCFIIGEKVLSFFIAPLMKALHANDQSAQIFFLEASESFMVYVKISMICAATAASPWMLFQFWQFVAAGLFPHERKYITGHMPLSILLLVSGMVFLYYIVLPLMLKFFLAFNIGVPVSFPETPIDPASAQTAPVIMPLLHGNPDEIKPGMMWFDADESRLKVAIGTADNIHVRVINFGSSELVSPMITLSAYIDMVVNMLISFGLAFQMPLVVLAIVRIGIVEVKQLKAWRRYVYFAISIIAGVIVPDVVGGMIALMIPLMLLFELGLWLARDRSEGSTGPWRLRARNWIKHQATGLKSGKMLQYVGIALLIGLLIYMMWRRRQESQHPHPTHIPAATQPSGHPTTGPAATPTVSQPTTQGANPK